MPVNTLCGVWPATYKNSASITSQQ